MIMSNMELFGYNLPPFTDPPDIDFIAFNVSEPLVNISLCCQTTKAPNDLISLPHHIPFILLGVCNPCRRRQSQINDRALVWSNVSLHYIT